MSRHRGPLGHGERHLAHNRGCAGRRGRRESLGRQGRRRVDRPLVAHNSIDTAVTAFINNAGTIDVGGNVVIRATNDAQIKVQSIAVAVSVAVSGGTPAFALAGGGSESTNVILSTTSAYLQGGSLGRARQGRLRFDHGFLGRQGRGPRPRRRCGRGLGGTTAVGVALGSSPSRATSSGWIPTAPPRTPTSRRSTPRRSRPASASSPRRRRPAPGDVRVRAERRRLRVHRDDPARRVGLRLPLDRDRDGRHRRRHAREGRRQRLPLRPGVRLRLDADRQRRDRRQHARPARRPDLQAHRLGAERHREPRDPDVHDGERVDLQASPVNSHSRTTPTPPSGRRFRAASTSCPSTTPRPLWKLASAASTAPAR